MKILGLIPARGGSKGIPGKNIKVLGDKPLLQYTYESAENSRFLSKVILSSEDPDIIDFAKKIKLSVPFTRPPELAEDDTPSVDVIIHALEYFKKENILFDAVCLLQPTSPFREKDLIDRVITKFVEEDFDSLVTVKRLPEEFNPHWVFEEKNGSLKIATGEKDIIPRRQDLPAAYYRDGAIYLTKADIILKKRSLYGEKIGFVDTTGQPHVNLDTIEDWKEAELILQQTR